MSQSARQHKAESPQSVACAVVTVSDTRTLETDTGGPLLCERLETAGHRVVARHLIPDEPQTMRVLLGELASNTEIDVILLTGGTGVGSRDQTYETVSGLLTKQLPGYGELFRMLSFAEIGPAAILSRAVGGLMGRTVVLSMPGSPQAVALALDRIILPELGHLVREARR